MTLIQKILDRIKVILLDRHCIYTFVKTSPELKLSVVSSNTRNYRKLFTQTILNTLLKSTSNVSITIARGVVKKQA